MEHSWSPTALVHVRSKVALLVVWRRWAGCGLAAGGVAPTDDMAGVKHVARGRASIWHGLPALRAAAVCKANMLLTPVMGGQQQQGVLCCCWSAPFQELRQGMEVLLSQSDLGLLPDSKVEGGVTTEENMVVSCCTTL